ncbi:MAG: hypothetical protein FJ387_21730 [Verrucomicrobia bacterium]|nr:hypothetical protein [Verrucomicrobiota bacterium]
MNLSRRSLLVYGLLLAAWAVTLAWQVVEHLRVRKSARAALIVRAKDISNTVGLVLRSQRRFGGIISKDRLESALDALVRQGDVISIALLNTAGDVVASAGAPVDLEPQDLVRSEVHWARHSVTLANLVDLGTNVTQDLGGPNPTIVLPRREGFGPGDTNRPPPAPPGPPPDPTLTADSNDRARFSPPDGRPGPRGPRDGRPPFGRPFWMTEAEYKAVIEKQGVHSFVIVLSMQTVRAVANQDFWLRSLIGALGALAVGGLAVAWRNVTKSSDLQIRLIRASELNLRLKEMNLAAAGLAHETRNPLNIIRGLAQMISKRPDVPAELQTKSRDIIDETDRVTAQLNEFINYSRPREVRRSTLALSPLVSEVVRALSADLEEKTIRLQPTDVALTIEADEQMLRQALFNLLLNAVQAVDPGGEIQIVAEKHDAGHAFLEVRDNGPGVPPDRRTEIFKPYVTSTAKGTGLGLAVVQQIVLAHSWEVECLPNEPRGARFRISHLRLVS